MALCDLDNSPNTSHTNSVVTQELIDYIQKELQKGTSREKITADLTSQGWAEEDIQEAFGKAGSQSQTPPAVSQAQINPSSSVYPYINIDYIQNPNRLYAFPIFGFIGKGIALLPQIVILYAIFIFQGPINIINSFVVLFTGKYWQFAYNLNLGMIRLFTKFYFFLYGLTDKYPSFSFDIKDNYTVNIPYPENPNRLFAVPVVGGVIRLILLIPFFVYLYIISYAAGFGTLISSIPVLIVKKYPKSTFELERDSVRLFNSSLAYMTGLSDVYPSFNISMNNKGIKLVLIAVTVLLILFYILSGIGNIFGRKRVTINNQFTFPSTAPFKNQNFPSPTLPFPSPTINATNSVKFYTPAFKPSSGSSVTSPSAAYPPVR